MRRRTRSRVSSAMSGWFRRTLEMVTTERPRSFAMSFMRTVICQDYTMLGVCVEVKDEVKFTLPISKRPETIFARVNANTRSCSTGPLYEISQRSEEHTSELQ